MANVKRASTTEAKEQRAKNWRDGTGPIEVQVRLDQKDSDLLRKLARKEDRSMASIVRRAIRKCAEEAGIVEAS